LTWDGAKGYKWDGFNRLREVSDGGGTIVTFVYDAQNRLARKDRPGTTNDIDYAYTGWQVVEQYESGDADPKRQFIYGNYIDEVLVMDVNEDDDSSCTEQAGDSRYFYHQTSEHPLLGLRDHRLERNCD
jgi:YD repeat-containing protein